MSVILDTGILQDLARVMIRDCRYDVSYTFMHHLNHRLNGPVHLVRRLYR